MDVGLDADVGGGELDLQPSICQIVCLPSHVMPTSLVIRFSSRIEWGFFV
jgi:hypothetical protein